MYLCSEYHFTNFVAFNLYILSLLFQTNIYVVFSKVNINFYLIVTKRILKRFWSIMQEVVLVYIVKFHVLIL